MLEAGQIILGVYALLLILGGIMGKLKAGSTVSLIAGSLSGLAALLALRTSQNDPAQGFLIGGTLAVLLAGVFLSRLIRTRKVMPAGIVLVLSAVVAISLFVLREKLVAPM